MNSRKGNHHSLFAPKQRGGVVGGTGYNFQDAYIVTLLPTWLAHPGFRSFIKEGFDDVDVVFANGPGAETWHYQLKDHEVSLAKFRTGLGGFKTAAARPGVNASSFILGCCGLAPKLASLWSQIKEFRGARKSHSEAALRATREELLALLAKHRLSAYADLLLDKVEIDYETPGLRGPESRVLMERFRGAFVRIPLYRGEHHEILDRLFGRLMVVTNRAIRVGITREELETVIRTELAAATKGRAVIVHLHGWVRQVYDLPPDEEIDWTSYFDHAALRVPAPEVWERELLPALQKVRRRFDEDRDRRLIWLRARAPLSAGIAFGHAFAEAAGYSIRIQQPSPGASAAVQYWETDSPVAGDYRLDVHEFDGDPAGQDILVGIGITDDPRAKVEHYLVHVGLGVRASVYLYPPGGPSATSVDERTAGACAAALKREIRRMCDRYAPRVIHLFYFGPLGLAVLLGQKLNGLADIQCYERNKTTGYTPSCRLPA